MPLAIVLNLVFAPRFFSWMFYHQGQNIKLASFHLQKSDMNLWQPTPRRILKLNCIFVSVYYLQLGTLFFWHTCCQVAALAMEDMIDWMHGGGQVSWCCILVYSLLGIMKCNTQSDYIKLSLGWYIWCNQQHKKTKMYANGNGWR